MSRKEEGLKLLSGQDSESDEEVLTVSGRAPAGPPPTNSEPQLHDLESRPPPSYSNPHPATLTPTSLPPMTAAMPLAMPVPTNEAPPDYSLHAKEGPLPSKAGLAVQIQIDGKLVPGTVMEDATGRHMVYICQPQPAAASSGPGDKPPPPKDYFFLSIISLLCCCAPLGIVALIKSMEVQRLYRRGDYAGALRASRQAHSWASAAVIFGATVAIIVFALKMYFAEFNNKQHYYYY